MVRDEAGHENGADCTRRLPSLRARAALPDRAVRSLAWTGRRAAAARHRRLPAAQSRPTVQIPAGEYREARQNRTTVTPQAPASLRREARRGGREWESMSEQRGEGRVRK